ncbi:hypothetical protein PENSPDRAFT_646271 [Peniophora sp. CONT]|nr:hypothetical protein PENSPDRAFT_646271 [Peniophora sp. CONT]
MLQAVGRVAYCRSNCSPEGLDREARWLFLRSILLCLVAATLSSQRPVRRVAVPPQVHAGLHDTRDQGTLQRGYPITPTPGTATHVSIAQALWTISIFLGGAALVLAALVSVKANTGGQSHDNDKRASRLQFGRTSLKLAAILNLIALGVTSIDDTIAQDILATATLVMKLAASSALALYSKERLR